MSRALHLVAVLSLSAACARDRAASSNTVTPPPAPAVKVNEVAAQLAPSVTLDPDNPQTCAACHTAVVAEWQESQHARAHHAHDALYAAMRTLRIQKQGDHIPAACATCHNPRDTVDHESNAARGGVTCATCHQLESVHPGEGRKGTGALVVGPDKVFRGPHDVENGVSPVHGNGPALREITDGKTLCLACHDQEQNPAGIPTCTTGVEHGQAPGAASCTSCHMEEVPGPSGPVSAARTTHRSHRFRGPLHAMRSKDLALLSGAVLLSGRFESNRFVAVMENRTQHGFPTGFPARMVVLDIRALDDKGTEVFRNITADPMKEHPEAVLNKVYVDGEGKMALAPFAEKMVRDNRLKPGETRELAVNVPADTHAVELRLRFFIAAPGMVKAVGYQGPEAAPLALAPVTVTR